MVEEAQPQPAAPPRAMTAVDVCVLLGVVVVVLLTPAAALIARAEPVAPALDVAARPLPADRSDSTLRDLPAGLPDDFAPAGVSSLRPIATPALGDAGARALDDILNSGRPLQDTSVQDADGSARYPYRYPAMTRLLDAAPDHGSGPSAVRLGAALMVMAADPASDENFVHLNAAAAAFAVLERARAGGDCAAQVNLLLLVASDAMPRDEPVYEEARRAEQACPADPTPVWLLGQYLSQRAVREILADPGSSIRPDALRRADAASARLAQLFPGSVPALTGRADNNLRAGLRMIQAQPFTARQRLRTAAEDYLTARDLDPDAAVPGLARSLIVLGAPDRAGEAVRQVWGRAAKPGPLMEILTVAEESARRFAEAERTARTLAARFATAYPGSSRLFPRPGTFEDEQALDPTGPQSIGTGTHLPLTVNLQTSPGGAGGSVDDLSFIPAYRNGPATGSDPNCPELGWRRNAILARHAGAALSGLPADPDAFGTSGPGSYCSLRAASIRDVALLDLGRPIEADQQDTAADEQQNLFRWAGDLERAEKAIRVWVVRAAPAAPLPHERLGEVLFLLNRHEEAAAAFGAAARRTRAATWDDDRGVLSLVLKEGVALLRTARSPDAMAMLRRIATDAERGAAFQRQRENGGWSADQFATVAYHARAQLADAEREAGAQAAALDDYTAARELLPSFGFGVATLHPERLDANQSLTELALGRGPAAAQSAARALQSDPASPVFLMNAGYIAERAGRHEAAARFNRQALEGDPGSFPVANDLGVVLARLGRNDEAVQALRRAVGARRGYALGWFNLGVVHGRMGPLHLVASQAALARAFALDETLRDAPRTPALDTTTYRTGVDLSRPLPPRWSLAGLPALSAVPATGLLAVLVLGLGLARAAGTPGAAQQWLETAVQEAERRSVLGRVRRPAWAIATTVAIFAFSAVLRDRRPLAESILFVLGVFLWCAVVVRSRRFVAARAGTTVAQQSWGPGIAFGVVTAVVAAWAPMPVIRPASTTTRAHAAAPVLLGLIGLVLFAESAALGVPLVRSLATAALVMVASVLVPIAPLDGAQITKAGVFAGAGLLGAAVLLGLQVV